MISQLQFVRLRAAEKALRQGNLDEAYRLATAADLRDNRRAKAVCEALAEPLLERARGHFREDRHAEALADLDRAQQGGVLQDEIAELRGHVLTVVQARHQDDQARQDRLQAARKRVEFGSVAAGKRILKDARDSDKEAGAMRQDLSMRQHDAVEAAEQAATLMAQGQLAAAVDRVRRARQLDAHCERALKVEAELCRHVLDAARQSLIDGRLSRAGDELSCLGALGDALPEKRELADLLATAGQAAELVAGHRFADARLQLLALYRLMPKLDWAHRAAKQLHGIEKLRTAVAAGPLGETIDTTRKEHDMPATKRALDETVMLTRPATARQPQRPEPVSALLLLVDGGGSYLIARSERVSLGRAAHHDPADVPILADLGARHADIARTDDDYFLFATTDVEVDRQPTRHQLLKDGNRVVLGKRAKFNFRLPSRQSASAVLDLSDTTKMPNDVRRVVLFDKHATVGPGASAHILCRHAGTPLILFERKGALWLRPKSDGHNDIEAVKLTVGTPVEMCGVGLALEPWHVSQPGIGGA